jgi:hypothetical protein
MPTTRESETKNASAPRCNCSDASPLGSTLDHIVNAAGNADRLLSCGPVPLKAILAILPREGTSRAGRVLRVLSAGARICELLADDRDIVESKQCCCRRAKTPQRSR